ncbi:MAG: co-chaperone GroES [Bacteroidales bacterium]|nr:co-chaperone GroES [Bacteroidales bacterium]
MKELLPVNQHVVLDISETGAEQRTRSGIIIPDSAREKPKFAKLVWMSAIENAEVSPGDTVLFKSFSGTEVEFEGKKYLILPYADLLAKIVETEAI